MVQSKIETRLDLKYKKKDNRNKRNSRKASLHCLQIRNYTSYIDGDYVNEIDTWWLSSSYSNKIRIYGPICKRDDNVKTFVSCLL